MNLVINALSALAGGGQTYLYQLIKHKDSNYPISIKLLVAPKFKDFFPSAPNVEIIPCEWASRSIIHRGMWENLVLPKLLAEWKTDVFFCPGGVLSSKVPDNCKSVVMFQNMHPFSKRDHRKYPLGYRRFRNWLLYYVLLNSMKKADLVIFISNYAQKVIQNLLPNIQKKSVCIPHGIPNLFLTSQSDLSKPVELPEKYLLYVSKFDVHKHQIEVVKAYSKLRNIRQTTEKLVLVGSPEYSWYKEQVDKTIRNLKLSEHVILTGKIPYEQLPAYYTNAKAIIFASTCENCPNILLESLGSGKPLFVSNKPPMPEFAEDAAIYFNPENPDNLAKCLYKYLDNSTKLREISNLAVQKTHKYSWKETAKKTYEFFLEIS